MALTCTEPGLVAAIPQSLNRLTPIQKKALVILYLYRQKFPATSGQPVPGDALLKQAMCMECGVSSTLMDSFEVWIQRQVAADNGVTEGLFVTSTTATAMTMVKSLANLSMHQLRAIELMLRCQLS